jgi:hypothetical protein
VVLRKGSKNQESQSRLRKTIENRAKVDRWKRESKTKRARGNREGERKTLETNNSFQVLKILKGKTDAGFPFFITMNHAGA